MSEVTLGGLVQMVGGLDKAAGLRIGIWCTTTQDYTEAVWAIDARFVESHDGTHSIVLLPDGPSADWSHCSSDWGRPHAYGERA